jgi:uncharacterized OB-fold protein
MPIEAAYLGMPLELNDREVENRAYFGYCAAHDFRLQQCVACSLIRYPPGTACPWCAGAEFRWVPVDGRGTVHSYMEVHHAIQPAFRAFTPYVVLLVDLDTQKGVPTEHEALRVIGNLVTSDAQLAPPDVVRKVGIGTRVRMVFSVVAPGLALPQWTLDPQAGQSVPWRYPE